MSVAFAIVDDGPAATFEQDVHSGLSAPAKSIPCKYFYDQRGSQTYFDRITELDAYYPTRTETAIMLEHAAAIAGVVGPNSLVIELGSGSSVKTRILLDALDRAVAYVPVDISAEHLASTAADLRRDYPRLVVQPVAADFARGFGVPTPPRPPGRRIVYFPGSTIGNFEAEAAVRLLASIRGAIGPGGGLLLGYDLVKPGAVLERAYDDEFGVTADFNKNLLARINAELVADFDLGEFDHVANWVLERSRMEIFLRSRVDQRVRVGDRSYEFVAGEMVHTEYSHKYTPTSMAALARSAGLELRQTWSDESQLFAVSWLEFVA